MDDPRDRFPRLTLERLPRVCLGVALLLLSALGGVFTVKAAGSAWLTSRGNDAKKDLRALDMARGSELAQAYYQRAIALDAQNPSPYLGLGETYRSQSLWRVGPARRQEREALARQAIDSYQASLARNPFQTQALLGSAYAYQLLQDMDNARKALEQALAVDPRKAFVYQQLGQLYQAMGEENKAAEAFQRAEELGNVDDGTSRVNLQDLRPRK